MVRIELYQGDITCLNVDAIVNAANNGLWSGIGSCRAIFKAAGLNQLLTACNKIGQCDVDSAVINSWL